MNHGQIHKLLNVDRLSRGMLEKGTVRNRMDLRRLLAGLTLAPPFGERLNDDSWFIKQLPIPNIVL